MQFCLQEKHQKIFLKRVFIDENQPCVCAHKTQQKQIVFVLFVCKHADNKAFKYFYGLRRACKQRFKFNAPYLQ